MFYEADMEDDRKEENTYFLDDDIVFKSVIICMATIYLLQLRGNCLTNLRLELLYFPAQEFPVHIR